MRKTMLALIPALSLLASVVAVAPASAGAVVRYELTVFSSFPIASFGGGSVSGGFVVESADFIVPPRYFGANQLLNCSMVVNPGQIPIVCGVQEFLRLYPGFDSIAFVSATGAGPFYHFNAGTFGRVGTFDTTALFPEQRGRLVITDLAPPPQISEPGTLALLGLGLAGLGLSRRRRMN